MRRHNYVHRLNKLSTWDDNLSCVPFVLSESAQSQLVLDQQEFVAPFAAVAGEGRGIRDVIVVVRFLQLGPQL